MSGRPNIIPAILFPLDELPDFSEFVSEPLNTQLACGFDRRSEARHGLADPDEAHVEVLIFGMSFSRYII
jgi:hypothetical protein